MPYIIKLELSSRRCSRAMYLLFANFPEKEKWDSTIEAIVSRGCMAEADRETVRQPLVSTFLLSMFSVCSCNMKEANRLAKL